MYFCLKMPNTGYVLKGNELNLFSSEGGKIFSGMKIFLKKQLNIYCSNTHIHMHKHTYYFFFLHWFFFFYADSPNAVMIMMIHLGKDYIESCYNLNRDL